MYMVVLVLIEFCGVRNSMLPVITPVLGLSWWWASWVGLCFGVDTLIASS